MAMREYYRLNCYKGTSMMEQTAVVCTIGNRKNKIIDNHEDVRITIEITVVKNLKPKMNRAIAAEGVLILQLVSV